MCSPLWGQILPNRLCSRAHIPPCDEPAALPPQEPDVPSQTAQHRRCIWAHGPATATPASLPPPILLPQLGPIRSEHPAPHQRQQAPFPGWWPTPSHPDWDAGKAGPRGKSAWLPTDEAAGGSGSVTRYHLRCPSVSLLLSVQEALAWAAGIVPLPMLLPCTVLFSVK